jgi:hypothetical protein
LCNFKLTCCTHTHPYACAWMNVARMADQPLFLSQVQWTILQVKCRDSIEESRVERLNVGDLNVGFQFNYPPTNDIAHVSLSQGDQIGWMFAYWAIIYFGHFGYFFHGICCILILIKRVGLLLGRFFYKLILSPWSERPFSQTSIVPTCRCYRSLRTRRRMHLCMLKDQEDRPKNRAVSPSWHG